MYINYKIMPFIKNVDFDQTILEKDPYEGQTGSKILFGTFFGILWLIFGMFEFFFGIFFFRVGFFLKNSKNFLTFFPSSPLARH